MFKVRGSFQVAVPITIRSVDCEFEEILEKAADLIDRHVRIHNHIVKEHLTPGNLIKEQSSITEWDLIDNGDIDDGYTIEINAIIPLEVEDLKIKSEQEEQILDKLKELLDTHLCVRDYVYSDLIDVGSVNAISSIEYRTEENTLDSELSMGR